MANGQILINEQPLHSKLTRFIEKKIHKWLEHREGGQPHDDVVYTVTFTEDSDMRQVSCVTEIQMGGSTWRGFDLATDTQSAFIHSLKRLQAH